MINEETELRRFLKVSDKNLQETDKDTEDEKYLKMYDEIHNEVTERCLDSRGSSESIMDVTFDGNLYSNIGASRNKYINSIQTRAKDTMERLSSAGEISPLNVTHLYMAISAAFTVVENKQDTYYQNVHPTRDGRVVSTKVDNLYLSVKASHIQLLAVLKTIKFLVSSIVDKNLFGFLWVFLDTLVWLDQNINITIEKKDVITLFYIQKYAVPSIPEEDLMRHILNNDLSFEFEVVPIDKGTISNSVNRLVDLKVIELVEGIISIKETIDIDDVDASNLIK